MAIDSRGVTYNPYCPSVMAPDGAVFQVLTTDIDPETGFPICDMAASAAAADQYATLIQKQ